MKSFHPVLATLGDLLALPAVLLRRLGHLPVVFVDAIEKFATQK